MLLIYIGLYIRALNVH